MLCNTPIVSHSKRLDLKASFSKKSAAICIAERNLENSDTRQKICKNANIVYNIKADLYSRSCRQFSEEQAAIATKLMILARQMICIAANFHFPHFLSFLLFKTLSCRLLS